MGRDSAVLGGFFFFLCVQKTGQVRPSQGSSEMLSLVTEVKEEKMRGKK